VRLADSGDDFGLTHDDFLEPYIFFHFQAPGSEVFAPWRREAAKSAWARLPVPIVGASRARERQGST
jgi:hypothetical protein